MSLAIVVIRMHRASVVNDPALDGAVALLGYLGPSGLMDFVAERYGHPVRPRRRLPGPPAAAPVAPSTPVDDVVAGTANATGSLRTALDPSITRSGLLVDYDHLTVLAFGDRCLRHDYNAVAVAMELLFIAWAGWHVEWSRGGPAGFADYLRRHQPDLYAGYLSARVAGLSFAGVSGDNRDLVMPMLVRSAANPSVVPLTEYPFRTPSDGTPPWSAALSQVTSCMDTATAPPPLRHRARRGLLTVRRDGQLYAFPTPFSSSVETLEHRRALLAAVDGLDPADVAPTTGCHLAAPQCPAIRLDARPCSTLSPLSFLGEHTQFAVGDFEHEVLRGTARYSAAVPGGYADRDAYFPSNGVDVDWDARVLSYWGLADTDRTADLQRIYGRQWTLVYRGIDYQSQLVAAARTARDAGDDTAQVSFSLTVGPEEGYFPVLRGVVRQEAAQLHRLSGAIADPLPVFDGLVAAYHRLVGGVHLLPHLIGQFGMSQPDVP
ncbi:hypothetical protein [Bifidobacterium choloepi]|uniref:Uncharacterized protein n=1 Tax=Bifidobacterium choloepi TaxID=2614131 RepID=A0A6I5MXH8_9BIFI|nr:hypothetical protein [Bifidobacterium choloepi]NEG69278.1 hypothetical protein [Bifidobacterium choloepi]